MRCLLVGNLTSPKEQLRSVMERLGVELAELNRLGIDWTSQTASPPVDFVCAVLGQLDAPEVEAATFLDIGVALGRGIPVFLVVEPRRAVPLALGLLTRVQADLDNEVALELHLKQFLKAIRRRETASPDSPVQQPTISRERAAETHERLQELRRSERGAVGGAFEWLMVDLLRGDAEISAPVDRDQGADLALMLPENYLAVGGPVLVQMKFWDTLSDRGLADACDIFAQQIHRTTAVFGLLIYHVRDGENPKQTVPNPGTRVVAVSADSLVDALAARPLSSVLFAMRNAIVHGVAYRG